MELVQLFERQVDYVTNQEGRRLLLALPRLVQFVAKEPRLRAIADELRTEYEAACQEYISTDDRLCLEFLQLWTPNEGWFINAWDAAVEAYEHDGPMRSFGHPSDIRDFLGRDRTLSLPADGYRQEQSLISPVLRSMDTMWLANVREQCRTDSLSQAFSAFRFAYDKIKFEHDVAQRRRQVVEKTHPGACWCRLLWFANSLVPPDTGISPDDDGWARLDKYVATLPHLQVANAALELGDHEIEKGDLTSYRGSILEALSTIREEVALRIGLHLSHRALVMRFKTKCERFMAQTLLERCKDASRPEDILTAAAAEYLFDQGLDPLFNAPIVTLRPDLFDPSLPHALYIEAKQYNDASPKSKVVRATWQVWDTWNQLDGQHKVVEAFLLIFRRGGPLLTFDECVRLNGRTLYPIVVDIAPTNTKGSQAKGKPVHISGEELLPQQGISEVSPA